MEDFIYGPKEVRVHRGREEQQEAGTAAGEGSWGITYQSQAESGIGPGGSTQRFYSKEWQYAVATERKPQLFLRMPLVTLLS